ncbi:MAG: adenosyl-hopene transferase HpnH [Rhodospirillaceae bacterium]|nr:adenosyl-hopene transferase HpnH [Rhodospirillaceae bacterium]
MGVPFIQQVRVGSYLLKQKLKRNKKYPLVLMLEPLYRCNLACSGCGKIDFPDHILNKRLSVKECIAAVEECGAPMVSIPGGEPLLHKEIDQIVAQLVKRKKFVYLCTNALLLEKKLHLFRPGRYLTFSVHLDGLKEHHDKAVDMEGGFEIAVSAIRAAKVAGFRVNVNCTLFDQMTADEAAEFFEFCTKDLKVEGITVSPGYAYERAEDQDNFLSREKTKNLFRDIFRRGKGKKWSFSQSSIFLDFLAGNQQLACLPWSMPSRNVFGWQKPCYLIGDGYVSTWKELIDETDWNLYGTGNYEKCANCMTHCGYEGAAVQKSISNPLKTMWVSLRGPKTEGPMVSEIDLDKARPAEYRHEQHILDAMDGVVLTERDLRWFAARGSETAANESTEIAAKKSA